MNWDFGLRQHLGDRVRERYLRFVHSDLMGYKMSFRKKLSYMLVSGASVAFLLLTAGCAAIAEETPTDEGTVQAESSAWRCVDDETAFGELRVLCRTTAEYVEGASVIMSFRMFCSLEPGEDVGYVVSRFSGEDFGGNSVGWQKRAEASFDGEPKRDLLLSPTSDAFLLENEQFGIDSLARGNTLDTVHFKVLPATETLLIRATLEPERVTTTSLFTWGDWQEPIQFLEERGCVWQ